MKRYQIHLMFALLAGITLFVITQNLYQIQRIDSSKQAVSLVDVNRDKPSNPWAVLVWANAKSISGQTDDAEAAYNELIRAYPDTQISRTALFNLGNSYLHQSLQNGIDSRRQQPLLELAKQRYRNHLFAVPHDWDARYNLELALRKAPEHNEDAVENKGKPIKRVNVVVPDFKIRDLP